MIILGRYIWLSGFKDPRGAITGNTTLKWSIFPDWCFQVSRVSMWMIRWFHFVSFFLLGRSYYSWGGSQQKRPPAILQSMIDCDGCLKHQLSTVVPPLFLLRVKKKVFPMFKSTLWWLHSDNPRKYFRNPHLWIISHLETQSIDFSP